MPRKRVAHALPSGLSDAATALGIREQDLQRRGEGRRIAQIGKQHTGDAVLDLILDSAHGGRQYRARLPHHLGHREPEALVEALLHDHS